MFLYNKQNHIGFGYYCLITILYFCAIVAPNISAATDFQYLRAVSLSI